MLKFAVPMLLVVEPARMTEVKPLLVENEANVRFWFKGPFNPQATWVSRNSAHVSIASSAGHNSCPQAVMR